jgi:hypothetical protein
MFNSCFKERKQKNKWCCEKTDLLDQETLRIFLSNNAKRKVPRRDETQLQILKYLRRK